MSAGPAPTMFSVRGVGARDAGVAVSDGAGRTYTWSQWSARVQAVARGLCFEVAGDPGDACRVDVAVDAERCVETVLLVSSLLEAGVPFALLHPRWSEDERTARCRALGDPPRIGPADVAQLESLGERRRRPLPELVDDERLAVAIFTSGSTGPPKAVALSRRSLAAAARASEQNLGWCEGDRWLLSMPLAHVGGFSVVSRCLAARRGVVVDPSPRFDPATLRELVDREHVTLLSLVPTMLHRLLDGDATWAPASLRALLIGGAAAPRSLLERAIAAALPVLTTYGLTETGSQVATQGPARLRDPDRALDVGAPLPGTEVRLLGADGKWVRRGETGTVAVRGATLFSGYLELCGATLVSRSGPGGDGWHTTSDLGVLNGSGHLRVLGRSDDVIVTGGENVQPFAVEEALRAIEGVEDACVVGMDDEEWGQVVGAVCVLAPPALGVDELEARCAETLAGYARPRRWCFVREIPLNAQAKPDRGRCAQLLLETQCASSNSRSSSRR